MAQLRGLACFLFAICLGTQLEPVLCTFPAIFVFGDSLLDAGNNDKLITLVKADRLPYGRDFVGHQPTGRFCNGPLSTDYIASLAGLPFPPAYLNAGDNILHGASFASGGAGILNSTGSELGHVIDFYQQVSYFSELKQRLFGVLGNENSVNLISKSLFLTFLGNNDYIMTYFGNPFGKTKAQRRYSPDAFRDMLISAYEIQLVDLYRMGARKLAMVSLPPISCIPVELLIHQGACDPEINNQSMNFNNALRVLQKKLQRSHADANFVYLNSYDMTWEIITDPTAYGFRYSNTACCGAGPHGGLPCFQAVSSACKNASEYVFWDLAHPTSAFNVLIANRFWAGTTADVEPMNLKDLAAL